MGREEPSLARAWDRRLERAGELESLWPAAREVLDFYRKLAEFQKALLVRLPESLPAAPDFLASFLPALLAVVEREGPPDLAGAAGRWRSRPGESGERALGSFWSGASGEAAEDFFPKVLLQPYAMALAGAWRAKGARAHLEAAGACPFCGHPPGLSILREDRPAAATSRSLACSLCALEWSFARVLCPGCGEERPEKLPRYGAKEFPWLRVEACDACGRYLKGVDLTRNPAAEPFVDELASTPLDVLARQEGYAKFEPNLAGI